MPTCEEIYSNVIKMFLDTSRRGITIVQVREWIELFSSRKGYKSHTVEQMVLNHPNIKKVKVSARKTYLQWQPN